jgi:FkbM family methyltransferase
MVPPRVRQAGRRTVNRLGVDIVRDPFTHRLVRMCRSARIDTVLDVGANAGQYARALRAAGFGGRILSFEPLSTAYRELARATGRDPRWEAVRTALGDRDGVVTVNIAGNSYSSSVLDMLPAHAAAAPQSHYVGTEEAPVTTVDRVCRQHGVAPAHSLLKLDVQGYEQVVLDGAADVLPRLAAVQVELSLTPLYETQPLMPEMVARLEGAGLQLWALEPGFSDPRSGRLLQCDGVFLRS